MTFEEITARNGCSGRISGTAGITLFISGTEDGVHLRLNDDEEALVTRVLPHPQPLPVTTDSLTKGTTVNPFIADSVKALHFAILV